ncbi:ATP-binding protein [Pseudomonas sp. JM0905a]|uniref:ATP-binding protein n=1 Tax=Pseudomonas sp. JM0905a TaxID=2772484 RepID=UPI001689459A|nr:ATP-binding protein [Pseudomonas sp. JM0905a]MBD2838999.1 ATP-binding protein [Pseudomonas sp. JM0905a]
MPSLTRWISQQKQLDLEWVQRYLRQKGHPIEGSGRAIVEAISEWERSDPEQANDKELLRELRGAWAQKNYRQSKGRTACSLILKAETKLRLAKLAQEQDRSMGEVVEALLEGEKLQSERLPSQKPPPRITVTKQLEQERLRSRALGELLIDALSDLAIRNLQLAELTKNETQPKKPSIPAILRTATDQLRERCRDAGIIGFDIGRGLAQQHIVIDHERIKDRLPNNLETPRAVKPRSITRRLAAAKLPAPNAQLDDLEHHSEVIKRVTEPHWPTHGSKLVITGDSANRRVWMACALARKHCLNGASVRYYTAFEFLSHVAGAQGTHRHQFLCRMSDAVDLLVIDGWDAVPWTPEYLGIMDALLEARESVGATIVVSGTPISEWAKFQDSSPVTKSILTRLGANTEKLLVMPSLTSSPASATGHFDHAPQTASTEEAIRPIAPTLAFKALVGDRVYPPFSAEARREPACTLNLDHEDENNRDMDPATEVSVQSPPSIDDSPDIRTETSEHGPTDTEMDDEAFRLLGGELPSHLR